MPGNYLSLDEFQKSPEHQALITKVFADLNNNKPLAVMDALAKQPLLARVKDNTYDSTLLQTAVYHLAHAESKNRFNFIQLIYFIIKYIEFDIRAANKDGNTVLHQIFRYAVKMPNQDPDFLHQLINIGLALLGRINDSKDFSAIVHQQNQLGETFTDNILVDPYKIQYPYQNENMIAVQNRVIPILKEKQPLKKMSKKEKTYSFEKQQQAQPPIYQYIDWLTIPSPQSVTAHPLWSFHEALKECSSKVEDFEAKKYWALAAIKSLIEIDINRQFVIEAGLAFERDLDNKIYVETSPGFFEKDGQKQAEFDVFRAATKKNVQPGDENKADTLRTSTMWVSPIQKEWVSFHPSISYPTSSKLSWEQRRASKEQQINYFYHGLQGMWRRIDSLDKSTQEKCLTLFCQHVKIDGIGCANERLGTAIEKLNTELISQDQKKITTKQMLSDIENIINALEKQNENIQQLFADLFTQHQGFTIEGESWVIEETSKKKYAEKIIQLGINDLLILDEAKQDSYLQTLIMDIPKKPTLEEHRQTPQIDLSLYQNEITSLLAELSNILTGLRKKEQSDSKYKVIRTQVEALYHQLNTGTNMFFKNQTTEALNQCYSTCNNAIDNAVRLSAEHRGWFGINPILRGILGVLAGMTILPGIAVKLTAKHGYRHTFFGQPETETKQQMKKFNEHFTATFCKQK